MDLFEQVILMLIFGAIIYGIVFCISIIQFIFRFIFGSPDSFQVQMRKDKPEELETEVILVEAIGRIPVEGQSVKFVTMAKDTTDKEKEGLPIFCNIDGFHHNYMYWFEKSIEELPHERSFIERWMMVGMFVPEISVFPSSGTREIECKLAVVDAFDNVCGEYTLTINHYNPNRGYLDIAKYKKELFKLELQILTKIAMSDKEFHFNEKEFLDKKIKSFADDYDEEERRDILKEMYAVMSESCKDSNHLMHSKNTLESSKTQLFDLLRKFESMSTDSEKYQLIRSCTDIMGSDGKVEETELKFIDEIAKYLKLDLQKINKLKDIHIFKADDISSTNAESVLGVSPEWSYEQIQSYLKEQFIKWNARIQDCDDDQERNRAQKMLDTTIELMEKYKDVKKAQ